MNSFRVRVFLCCVPAIFANGCPSAPSDPCAGVTCDANETCVDGTCEAVVTCCDALSNCAPRTCLLPNFCVNGACVECEITADCDNNELCTNGSCVACNDNNACTSDFRVVDELTVEFVCSSVPFPCITVFECPVGCNVACLNNLCFAPP